MKNPNGFGTVYKFGGNHRKSWAAYTRLVEAVGEVRPKQRLIGCYSTKEAAPPALADWHKKRPTIHMSKEDITFQQLSLVKFPTLLAGTQRCYRAMWKRFREIHHAKVKNIRTGHFQSAIAAVAADGMTRPSLHPVKALACLLAGKLRNAE